MVCKPHGVWAVISPFNFPFMLANGMALGALITGNSVVLKPTSEAPLASLMLYRAYRDAGVPAGVVLRQSPLAGFQVAPGEPISLEVSR